VTPPDLIPPQLPLTDTTPGPRILIAGGGTGGHVIPALAVARQLVARHNAQVLFVGTARGMETRLVPAAGFALKLVEVGPLNQVAWNTRLRTLVLLPMSLVTCSRYLSEFRAQAVLGVGGYASGPAMGAAIQRGIPAVAFEPNAVPGLANRLVGRRVQAAAVNFAPAARWFRNPQVTGIPVRPEFFALQPPSPLAPPHLLIFGGSQGARIFNTVLPPLIPALLAAVPGLTILHQAGARHADSTRQAYADSGADPARWRVEAFLDDMATEIGLANLVMSRSGASTVAELSAAGKAALLIPFAAAADDHQRKNADVMVDSGAAELMIESQLPPHNPAGGHDLLTALTTLLADREKLAAMGECARTLARPQAAEHIADRLADLARH